MPTVCVSAWLLCVTESGKELSQLQNSLGAKGATLTVSVFDYLTYEEAWTKGRETHISEES